VYECNGNPAQSWRFENDTVKTTLDGRCLTTSNGVKVQPCIGSANQKWTRDPDRHIRSGNACLFQTDPVNPGGGLVMAGCAPNQPELAWRW
jgi:hypothetical protein